MKALTMTVILILNLAMYMCQRQPPPGTPDGYILAASAGGPQLDPTMGHNPQKMEPTIAPPDIDVTDMPEEISNQALDVYKYRYNNTEYHYQDNQDMQMWITPRPKGMRFKDNCIQQYMKCLISQSAPEPVCAYNAPFSEHELMTASSYCDVYYDNCRRGYRVWRILDTGICGNQKAIQKDEGYLPKYSGAFGRK